MPEPARPLWAGRALALVAIVLLALNLRTAVAALSPIAAFIDDDVPLDALALGVLGMLAPVAFSVCGLLVPPITRRTGLEPTLVAACLAMVAGPLIRAAAGSPEMLFAGTALTFLGMGIGNVLLPPAVKRYFPDRIGTVTAAYATMFAVSSSIPPALAVPLAEAAGWRISLAVWGVLAVAALVPWAVLWARGRRSARASTAGAAPPPAVRAASGRLWSSGIAWAMVLAFGASSINVYAIFAWLPQLLIQHAGVSPAAAGTMLAVYAVVGLPLSLGVPVLAVRLRSVAPLVYFGVLCFVAGYGGLLLAPQAATTLWVVFAGAGPVLFPVVLVLINTRTRTPSGSVALSGFTQSIGYAAGALGPLVVGVLHETTGEWTAPLIFLLVTGVLPVLAGLILRRPGYVDEPRG